MLLRLSNEITGSGSRSLSERRIVAKETDLQKWIKENKNGGNDVNYFASKFNLKELLVLRAVQVLQTACLLLRSLLFQGNSSIGFS